MNVSKKLFVPIGITTAALLAAAAAAFLLRTPPTGDSHATHQPSVPEDRQAPGTQSPAASDRYSEFSSTRHPESSAQVPESSIQNSPSPLLEGLSLAPAFIEQFTVIATPELENYFERHAAVQALTDDLDDHEIKALYRFLLADLPDGEIQKRHDRAIKNDVINRLRAQNETPRGLTDVLVAMFDDSAQDQTIRDYALQQMRAWHEDAPLEERASIREAVSRGMKEDQGSIGGTALLAFRQFEGSGTGDRNGAPNEVKHHALAILHSETTSKLSRITAMQVAAETAPAEIFDTAVRWALDAGATYPLRLSAIAALGKSGSDEAAAILEQLDSLEEPYLQPALQTAYNNLRRAGVEIEFTQSR